jgi:hypothetical protein
MVIGQPSQTRQWPEQSPTIMVRVAKKQREKKKKKKSASADGGPRSLVYARETLCSAPIDTSGNCQAYVSAESPSNISPNPSDVISKVAEP